MPKQHPSWKAQAKKPAAVKDWSRHYADQQAQAQRALAEGQHRPEPSLSAPQTYDQWFDAKVARIKAEQEAREAAEQDQE